MYRLSLALSNKRIRVMQTLKVINMEITSAEGGVFPVELLPLQL